MGKGAGLLFSDRDIRAIRAKVHRYGWAGRLYEQLKTAVDGGREPFHLGSRRFTLDYPQADIASFPDAGLQRGMEHLHQSRMIELALVARISGDVRYAERVRALLIVMAAVITRGNDTTRAAWSPQSLGWASAHDVLELLVAYDLIYEQAAWTDAERRTIETAFTDVMEMILAEPSARRLSNTSFYYQPYKVACGCFFDRDDWIEAGLRGRGGFFDALRPPEGSATEMRWYRFGDDDSAHHRIQRHGSDGAPRGTADGMIWNETGVYGSVMLSQYCIIAELMRLHGGIDLWSYRTREGASIRSMFDGFVLRSFRDGDVALFGENGMYDRRYPGHDRYVTSGVTLFNNPRKHIGSSKFDLAYARYGDPGYGWIALRNPHRDDWDQKLGYCALWYGVDGSNMEVAAPDVTSRTFGQFGIAMLRSTEGPAFWDSDTPAAAVTWGGHKYRSHPDQLGFTLHAYGRVIEPDLCVPWDYGIPQGGRNPTPFTASSWCHNVLNVDGRSHGTAAGLLVVDDYGAHVKVLGLAGPNIHASSYREGVEMARWLLLTSEYLLDVTYIANMFLSHRFDLVIPAYGTLSVAGAHFEEYDLGADLGYLEIDRASSHPENRWITEGRKAHAPTDWTALLHNDDGVDLAIHSTGWDSGEILTGTVPICWAPYLEGDARREPEPLRGRYTILLHRKHASQDSDDFTGALPMSIAPNSEEHCHYVTVHEPFRDRVRIASVRRLPLEERHAEMLDPYGAPLDAAGSQGSTPRVVAVEAAGFTDYFIYVDHYAALRGREPGHVTLETPVFRVGFSGPYAYLRLGDGRVQAQQGDIDAVRVLA